MDPAAQYSPRVRLLRDLVGGACAGFSCIAIGQPFDYVKTRMQAMNFTSSAQVLRHAIKTEGLLSIYKGSLVPLMLNSPATSVLVSTTMATKAALKARGYFKDSPLKLAMVGGAVGGAAMSSIATPMEGLRIRMQTQTLSVAEGGYSGSVDAGLKILRSHGISGLYKGAGVTLARDALGFAFYFATYDMIKNKLSNPGADGKSISGTYPIASTLGSGGLAGMALWTLRYPLDTVKTRLQADNLAAPRWRGMGHCFYDTIKFEGARVLFKGYPACILRTIPVNAGFFATLEASRWAFDQTIRNFAAYKETVTH